MKTTRTTINLDKLAKLVDAKDTPSAIAAEIRAAVPALVGKTKTVCKSHLKMRGLTMLDRRTGTTILEPRECGALAEKALWLNSDGFVFDLRKDAEGEQVLVITRKR